MVGACVLNGAEIKGLNDSKKLTKKQREMLNKEILASSAVVGLGWVESNEVDKLGLSNSLRLATRRAVKEVQSECQYRGVVFDEIIIDGTVNFLQGTTLERYVTTLAKADLLIESVSAAAICAKVARDNFMAELDEGLPGYNFGGHVGYGTKAHRQALIELGVCNQHRVSFRPVAEITELEIFTDSRPTQTTKEIGDKAESLMVESLKVHGHEIVARNWRTRWCEIDIVSVKDDKYYFTEVKYRKNSDFGGSNYAINDTKLKQMAFSAEIFVAKNKLRSVDMQLAAGLVEGEAVADWFVIE